MRSIAEMSQSFDCPLSAWADAGSVSWLDFLSTVRLGLFTFG